jgi:glucokinase
VSAAIGIDVGGSSLRAALVDENGKILRAQRRRLGERNPKALLDQLEALLQSLAVQDESLPIAMGLAAIIHLKSGMVAVAPNLGWRDVPFGQLLAERFERPVRLVNDLDAITVGEARCGAGRGADDVICVFVGTGVGMGAVVHGRVLEGHNGTATELGHVKVESAAVGRPCGCGERGCLETYASGRHLPDLLVALAASGKQTRLLDEVRGDLKALTAERIEAAARDGDAAARALWASVTDVLGRAIGNVVTLFNPRVLILGGGVLNAAPSLRHEVALATSGYAGRPQLADVEIRESELGDHAGLVGAGLLAHQSR